MTGVDDDFLIEGTPEAVCTGPRQADDDLEAVVEQLIRQGGAPRTGGSPQPAQEEADATNPSYYKDGPKCGCCGNQIELIQFTERKSFNLGCVIKYVWRAGKKGDAVTDLKKAAWYLDRELDRVQRGD